MAGHPERDVLNRLIQTRDGERGFRYAANHVRSPEVKLFVEIARQRDEFDRDMSC